jgi:choice-of-anchor A domain-containing protein
MRRTVLRRCAVAGVAALVLPVALFASAPATAADVAPVNPVSVPVDGHSANQGFLVFVEGDVQLAADESEGTLAAGGDLGFETSYNVGAGNTPTDALTLPGDDRPTFLYVGGGVRFPADQSSVLRVLNGGYTHVGDTTSYDAFDTDQNGAAINYRLAPEGTTAETVPRIEGTVQQSAADVPVTADPAVLDFAASFARYRSLSTDIGTCPATTELQDASGAPVTSPVPQGTAAFVDVRPGATNVLTVPGTDLDALALLTFRGLPDPSSPLVVNVTGSSFDGTIPNLANLTSANAPFVLWNFPDATSVHVTGADALEGTIYAPRADVRWDVTQNIEGNVIAASFTHGVASAPGPLPLEIHSFPFSTTVSCLSTDAAEGSLTLVKQVEGGTADPSDWTLSATGPTTISGPSGSPAVTEQTVSTGDYTLTESAGPDGYTAGAWSCTGAPVTESIVTIGDGDAVVCTVVNTATPMAPPSPTPTETPAPPSPTTPSVPAPTQTANPAGALPPTGDPGSGSMPARGTGPSSGGPLAYTGYEPGMLTMVAAVLVLAGTLLAAAARHRRRAR